MERIDRRARNLATLMAARQSLPLMRSKVRAYSHQGHGPRADQQAGYISATSDSTPSLANCSRSIHLGRLLPATFEAASVCYRRVSPIPFCRREGRLTQSTAGLQPEKRERALVPEAV